MVILSFLLERAAGIGRTRQPRTSGHTTYRLTARDRSHPFAASVARWRTRVSGRGRGHAAAQARRCGGKGPILASRASALLRAVATALHRRVINVARIDGYRCTSEHDCIDTSARIARSQIEAHELCDQSSTITAVTLRLPRGEGYADWYCRFPFIRKSDFISKPQFIFTLGTMTCVCQREEIGR
jgi:hypothetical protein